MRSWTEIRFRLRQEVQNLRLLLAQPQYKGPIPGAFPFPAPRACAAALKGSLFEFTVLTSAKNILAHKFPLLGTTIDTGPEIDWRRDYPHGKTSDAKYFRLVPYLNFDAVGDHKFIWELSRHQHLVTLAQAYLLTNDAAYLEELFRQLQSWLEQNPFQKGINWASALEVAFRALSWIWVWHLCGGEMPAELRSRFLTSLYQHGLHLAQNLSVYFSPNTHLLGEAVALHALGTLFPDFPQAAKWRENGSRVVDEQLAFQMKPDGSHFEQSTYYHVYAVDFFVFHYLLAGKPSHFEPALYSMAEYLHWLLGSARRIAYFGDDDGGRLFHPLGRRDQFGRATLATCGILSENSEWLGSRDDLSEQALWWIGPACLTNAQPHNATPVGGRLFPDAGAVFLQSAELFVQFDAGPFGWGGAGHSHADTLSLVAWRKDEAIFVDPGTFTYIADPEERDRFRGTAIHNTVSIDGRDQARPQGPFRWTDKPGVCLEVFLPSPEGGIAVAVCEYSGYTHRRRILLKGTQLLVWDEIEGGLGGERALTQRWNLGPAAAAFSLSFSAEESHTEDEVSNSYGAKNVCPVTLQELTATLPASLAMLLGLGQKTAITVTQARQMFDNEEARLRSRSNNPDAFDS